MVEEGRIQGNPLVEEDAGEDIACLVGDLGGKDVGEEDAAFQVHSTIGLVEERIAVELVEELDPLSHSPGQTGTRLRKGPAPIGLPFESQNVRFKIFVNLAEWRILSSRPRSP